MAAARGRPVRLYRYFEAGYGDVEREHRCVCNYVFPTNPYTSNTSFYCPSCMAPHICIYRPPFRPSVLPCPDIRSICCSNCDHLFDVPPISDSATTSSSICPRFACPNCLLPHLYFRPAPPLHQHSNAYAPHIINNNKVTPASGSFIESLPIRVFSPNSTPSFNSCSICMEDFKTNYPFVTMPCEHYFHKDCIVEWLQRRNTCPLCRYKCPPAAAVVPPEEPRRGRRRRRRRQQSGGSGTMLDEDGDTIMMDSSQT
ncbi:hypothetical protein BUALT_Bualt16G0123200 [Buddleja alternifolia]|uniref:RING-type domain-containing protein n=1 Tax=Buddleja alternifolia TaxID=168488 RepID=A0AAV6WCJ9_9LAMI|nr:hypothetical protein BUALT_Bualt16G0123200 [Buddleja alternifolia]